MTHIGKVFRAGNSTAVRLPKDVAFALGTELSIERHGDTLTLKPVIDRDAIRRDWKQLAADIKAIWDEHGGPPKPEVRDSDIFPDRPGLY